TLPDVARRFALPARVEALGVRRYGFHGLSYEWAVSELKLRGKAVIAHLGNGASMCAVRDGVCSDTTMGLTPAGGFMMGTRTGDLDPGVIVFLLERMSREEIAHLVERESGLLGVSGLTSDMKTLLASRDPRARLAVEMFCYQACKGAGVRSPLSQPLSDQLPAWPVVASVQDAHVVWVGAQVDTGSPRIHFRVCIRTRREVPRRALGGLDPDLAGPVQLRRVRMQGPF